MNTTKAISTVGIGAAIIAGSLLAVTAASAHEGGKSTQDERATAIAERFNLDETEVKAYFEEQKAEHQAKRETKAAEHISSLVEAGILTQAQADELKTMKEEARASADKLKDEGGDREALKSLMEENRTKVEAWATSKGINLDDIRPKGAEKGDHDQHGPRENRDTSDASSES